MRRHPNLLAPLLATMLAAVAAIELLPWALAALVAAP